MNRMLKRPIKLLRQLMQKRNVDVYVLPRTDEHQSQYLSPSDERVAHISGFTGSNALALIGSKEALLWTDGRYFLQAEKQLETGWQMKKIKDGEDKWFEHIVSQYEKGKTKIEIDGKLISAKSGKERKKYFQQKGFNVNFTSETNLVDLIWQEKPKQNMIKIFLHEKQAGRCLEEKVGWVRDKIKQKNGTAALFTDLGQISWLLNLRSAQIPYNPFFKSILTVGLEGGTLFLPKLHPSLNDQAIKDFLSKAKLNVSQYQPKFQSKTLCQENLVNYSIYSRIQDPIQWQGLGIYRATRTNKQIQGFRRCHLVDGVALSKFWAWRSNFEQINQYQASLYLDKLRYQQIGNAGLSFPTISAGGPNGAIIHYRATKQNSIMVTKNMIHLVDSGGQYFDGTTDVTRAFHFGTPTREEKQSYTRVLLGNLDIQRFRWPKNAKLTGSNIDILARRHLWMKGLQYNHGTGHGVGYFGSVHEGPVGISLLNKTIFQNNMIVTNQPGYYLANRYGIRIQNMLVVREIQENWLSFEVLTLCPYDKNLLSLDLLQQKDVTHINDYHNKVWLKLSPLLQKDKLTLQWLRQATLPISRT